MLAMVGSAIVLAASGSNHDALAGINAGGAPVSSQGTLTQFSSIYVNGVKFETDHTVFLVDGELGSESDLRVGQVVTVFGSVDDNGTTGTAHLVIYENAVRGPVSDVRPADNRLTVLGQTIEVSADTSYSVGAGFDSIDDLANGDIVEVSGHVNADGIVVATHISDGANRGFDMTGVVTSVAEGSYRLTVGDVEVDFGGAGVDGFWGGNPQVGDRVEVTGSHVNAAGELLATWISNAPQALSGIAGDDAEVEGLITRYASPWSFDVNGVPVSIRWSTQFAGGWLFDLGPNVKVEVEGYFDGTGRVVADSIEFESASSGSVAGLVEGVYGDIVIVNGSAVRVTSETEFQDESDADEHRFGVDNLRTGDYVRIRSHDDGSEAIATRLERHDDDSDSDD